MGQRAPRVRVGRLAHSRNVRPGAPPRPTHPPIPPIRVLPHRTRPPRHHSGNGPVPSAGTGGASCPFPECQGPLLSIRSLSEEVRTQRRFGNILPIPITNRCQRIHAQSLGERVMVGRKRLEHDSHEMCERHESAGIFRVFRTFRVLRGPSACTPHSNHASRFLEAPHLAHSRNVRDRCCRFAHSVKKCARSADSGTTAYSITNRCQRSRTQPLEVQVTVGRKRLDHDSHEMCERHESAGSFRVFRTFRVLRGPSACTPHSNHASRFLETPHRAAAGGAAPPFREWASAIRRYGWSHRPIPGMSGQERPRAQPIRPFRQSVFYPSPSSPSSAPSRYLMS
jgi:hypothetical protein